MSSEQKIRNLCTEVMAVPEGSKEFWQYLVELRDALEEHIARLQSETGNEGTTQETGSKIRRAS